MEATPQQPFDGLFSHDKRDLALVRPVYDRLTKESCDGRPLTVWLDDEEVEGGSVVAAINRGLEQSRHVIVGMTHNYFQSRKGWTDAEWMSAVYDDPAGRLDRVIPVLLGDANVPALLRHLDTIDLREPKRARRPFEVEYGRLVRRLCGQGRTTIGTTREPQTLVERVTSVPGPDAVAETVVVNLLGAVQVPETIVVSNIVPRLNAGSLAAPRFPPESALTEIVRETKHLAGDLRRFIPALRRHGDAIVSFAAPTDRLLASVADVRSYVHDPLTNWTSDPDRRRVVVSLMNAAVRDHAAELGLVRHPRHPQRFFYERPLDKTDRKIRWRGKGAPFTVTFALRRTDGSVRFWLHRAVEIHAELIGGEPFLQLHPTIVCSWDGTVYRWMGGPAVGEYVRAYVARERNGHLHRHLLYWISVLGQGTEAIQLPVGAQRLVFDTRLAQIHVPFGIADDQVKISGAALQEATLEELPADADLLDNDDDDLDRLAESVREHEATPSDPTADEREQQHFEWRGR